MSDEPADWRRVRLRAGQWSCPFHGPISPATDGLVPYCPHRQDGRPCLRMALKATDVDGKLQHVEPRPEHCPVGHPFGPGTVLVGTRPCPCTPVGFHRWWSCQRCDREAVPLQWPPHDPNVTPPR